MLLHPPHMGARIWCPVDSSMGRHGSIRSLVVPKKTIHRHTLLWNEEIGTVKSFCEINVKNIHLIWGESSLIPLHHIIFLIFFEPSPHGVHKLLTYLLLVGAITNFSSNDIITVPCHTTQLLAKFTGNCYSNRWIDPIRHKDLEMG